MSKEMKYILFLILAIVLAGLVYFLVTTSKKSVVDQKIAENAAVIENTEVVDGTVGKDANWAPTNESTHAPSAETVYTKEIKLELMTSAEKKKIGLDDSLKIQVLEKAEDGTILAYRVITKDNPVLEKYGN